MNQTVTTTTTTMLEYDSAGRLTKEVSEVVERTEKDPPVRRDHETSWSTSTTSKPAWSWGTSTSSTD